MSENEEEDGDDEEGRRDEGLRSMVGFTAAEMAHECSRTPCCVAPIHRNSGCECAVVGRWSLVVGSWCFLARPMPMSAPCQHVATRWCCTGPTTPCHFPVRPCRYFDSKLAPPCACCDAAVISMLGCCEHLLRFSPVVCGCLDSSSATRGRDATASGDDVLSCLSSCFVLTWLCRCLRAVLGADTSHRMQKKIQIFTGQRQESLPIREGRFVILFQFWARYWCPMQSCAPFTSVGRPP